jgi:hypothetical protein
MFSILVSGKAGVGKTTFSVYLEQYLPDITMHLPFARGVKDIASAMGWDGCKDDKGRLLLQKIGAVGREYNPDVWVKKALVAGVGCDYLVHDDWRFPNELNFMRNKVDHTLAIRIEAPERELLKGSCLYNDISETSLPSATIDIALAEAYYDIIIYNNLDVSLKMLESVAKDVSKLILNGDIK